MRNGSSITPSRHLLERKKKTLIEIITRHLSSPCEEVKNIAHFMVCLLYTSSLTTIPKFGSNLLARTVLHLIPVYSDAPHNWTFAVLLLFGTIDIE